MKEGSERMKEVKEGSEVKEAREVKDVMEGRKEAREGEKERG